MTSRSKLRVPTQPMFAAGCTATASSESLNAGIISSPLSLSGHSPQRSELLSGRYRVEGIIGCGGIGYVMTARNVWLDCDVALKFLRPELVQDSEIAAHFVTQARAAFRIKNACVISVFDLDIGPNGTPFIVMELLRGHNLRRLLEPGRRLPVGLAVDIALLTCRALAAAHAVQVVHRDIKPENLFLLPDTREFGLKVVDFGVSKLALARDSLKHGGRTTKQLVTAAAATLPYMSPEEIRGERLDGRADQWSLACVLYEMLTGVRPFERIAATQVRSAILDSEPRALRAEFPDVPRELEHAIMRCLHKDVPSRFPEISMFARAIAPFSSQHARFSTQCVGSSAHRHRFALAPRIRSDVVVTRDLPIELPRNLKPRASVWIYFAIAVALGIGCYFGLCPI
jgi:eukaryotic-like serine/threonine-protein kinase